MLPEKDKDIHQKYRKYVDSFRYSVYILHVDMMRFVAEEILFFYNINLITAEEVECILEDCFNVLEELEFICDNGKSQSDRKHEIHVFFTNILHPNEGIIIKSDELNFALIYGYFLNPIVSKDRKTFEIMLNWFNSWMHSAYLISISDPVQRLFFFKKQRADLSAIKEKILAI